MSQKLHMLETHQKETHGSLVQMERTAISMYQVGCLLASLLLHALVTIGTILHKHGCSSQALLLQAWL